MLGFGPISSAPLSSLPDNISRLTSDIVQEVVTLFVNEDRLRTSPDELHHFTSLETACKIIEGDDVRMSHAEYSNDQMEMEEAKKIILDRLRALSPTDPLFPKVLAEYEHRSENLDAFIFCMSRGKPTDEGLPQDILSQWRAYGQDGRGICLTLNRSDLQRLIRNTPTLRLNPAIYDRKIQVDFIDAILNRVLTAHHAGAPNAHEAAVAALVFATPLMKAPGFSEEDEWRLIFMPPKGINPQLKFHPRRDFLAPYITLKQIWETLRPAMLEVATLADMLPPEQLREVPHVPPLIPITQIMVGPSGHQSLNERAMAKLIAQTPHRAAIAISTSKIPYRSLA